MIWETERVRTTSLIERSPEDTPIVWKGFGLRPRTKRAPQVRAQQGRTQDYAGAPDWFRRTTNECAAGFFMPKNMGFEARFSRLGARHSSVMLFRTASLRLAS